MNFDASSKYEEIYIKIKLKEEFKIHQVEMNQEISSLFENVRQNSDLKTKEKCGEIFEELRMFSVNNTVGFDENGQINSTPLTGKGKDFQRAKIILENCITKIERVHYENLINLKFLNNFRAYSSDLCFNKCKKLDNPKDCIRDCFNFKYMNTIAINDLMRDQLIKYLNAINKL